MSTESFLGNQYGNCLGNWGTTKYYRMDAGLFAYGDYTFLGTGDAWNSRQITPTWGGLRGSVTFAGSDTSHVTIGAGMASQFCHVFVDMGPSGVVMLDSDVSQNLNGDLLLTQGIIAGDDHTWSIINTTKEKNLVQAVNISPNANRSNGTVFYGSRDSYVTAPVNRAVNTGAAAGGVVEGGYLYPAGGTDAHGTHYWRPLILQLPVDLGTVASVSVQSVNMSDDPDFLQWPENDLVVDGSNNDMLTLDNTGHLFWKVMLDENLPHNPNIRVVADGLVNVFNIKGLRLVQWDCDGTNARLAGVYDTSGGQYDDESMLLNDFLNGVPNLTQEGIDLSGKDGDGCSIIGVASNFLENPIGAEPIVGGVSNVQFIHNVVGATVDLYIDDNRVLDDFQFRSASSFGIVAAGAHKLDFVLGNAPDNSAPLYTTSINFRQDQYYHVAAHGNLATGAVGVSVEEGVRIASMVSNKIDFYLVARGQRPWHSRCSYAGSVG